MPKIKHIEIEIAGETLRLSVKQARELRDILCETFPDGKPEKVVMEVIRDRYWRPYWMNGDSSSWVWSRLNAGSSQTLKLKALDGNAPTGGLNSLKSLE